MPVRDHTDAFPGIPGIDNPGRQGRLQERQGFSSFLGASIPPSEGEIRLFDYIDIIITGAGEEFRDLVLVEQANTGITSAQNIPVYTNIEEGLGVFTSRFQLVRRGIRIGNEARDSLQNGIFTKDINFN